MMESSFIKVASCTINQWALDFSGNKKRIAQSISEAKKIGATLRVGPELEVCGNDCEDHFYEIDTVLHSWELVASLIQDGYTDDIVIVLGMPTIHHGILFDCSVVIFNREVILIKPKITLSDDGNYREGRWFTAWRKNILEEFRLPPCIQSIKGQSTCPIGHAIVDALDTSFMMEMCEEMWAPMSSSIQGGLEGAEIFINQSASHGFVGKTKYRLSHIHDNLFKNGGIYIYSNFRGTGGTRLVYDGNSSISLNGKLMATDQPYSFKDVTITSCELNLNEVRSHRIAFKARGNDAQKSFANPLPRVKLNFRMAQIKKPSFIAKPIPFENVLFNKDEEIVNMITLYLWEYLRGSKAGAFFLPLSGGIDSASVLTLVFILCCRLCEEGKDDDFIIGEVKKILGDDAFEFTTPHDLMKRLMYTAYLGTACSSTDTRERAAGVAEQMGSTHLQIDISGIYDEFLKVAEKISASKLKFKSEGGPLSDDLSLQNVQARSRNVLAYLLAQLLPEKSESKPSFVLVLSSGNLCESLSGYLTKYDNSSGDLNPIGSLGKSEVRLICMYAQRKYGITSLQRVLDAKPSAELTPLDDPQYDGKDIGMEHEEIEMYAYLREIKRCGPLSMFSSLVSIWDYLDPAIIAEKVKFFFRSYAKNRHKLTVYTPCIHVDNSCSDDKRYDLRPFLYGSDWDIQFKAIDEEVQRIKSN